MRITSRFDRLNGDNTPTARSLAFGDPLRLHAILGVRELLWQHRRRHDRFRPTNATTESAILAYHAQNTLQTYRSPKTIFRLTTATVSYSFVRGFPTAIFLRFPLVGSSDVSVVSGTLRLAAGNGDERSEE
jgi:hypothetical protein